MTSHEYVIRQLKQFYEIELEGFIENFKQLERWQVEEKDVRREILMSELQGKISIINDLLLKLNNALIILDEK